MRTLPVLTLSLLAACSGDPGTGPGDDDDDDVPPAGCVEENGACVLEGAILEDTTLTADVPWLLRSLVTVGDDGSDVTLTIEPGTTIYGENATNGLLVVTRGANLHAEGTAQAPIRFTSDQPEGSRNRGDWGGIAINGYGRINGCAAGVDPCEAEGEGGTGTYGGADDADDSGVLKYVVIEFGGTEISPDNEVNGLGLQGVGSGTELDYVQIHRNLDDGIEFWGGAAQVKHLVVTAPGDDGIDWDFGWSGRIQHAVVQQADDAGNNGNECDNNADDHLATPTSSPTVANLTILGSEQIAEENFAMVFRTGASPRYWNVAAAGFSTGCLALRDEATLAGFLVDSVLENVVLACASPFEDGAEEQVIFEAGAGNATVADLMLTDAAGHDLRPASGSPLLGADAGPGDPWFDATTHIGAFDATNDWSAGWTSTAAN